MNKELIHACREKNIDVDLTREILDTVNHQQKETDKEGNFQQFPDLDDKRIFSTEDNPFFKITQKELQSFLEEFLPDFSPEDLLLSWSGNSWIADTASLKRIGILLYPYTAYGILNGGSATSYIDKKKNSSYGKEVFSLVEKTFTELSSLSNNKPKGITPAFTQPDGRPGNTFIELKMRSLLIETIRYNELTKQVYPEKNLPHLSGIPLFQMTSTFTEEKLRTEYKAYKKSHILKDLIDYTGFDVTSCYSAQQPLIAAFTSTQDGYPLSIFSNAWNKKNNPLSLPGGHGQNFLVLKDIYRELYSKNKKLALLGNVDNLGNTLDPVLLAVSALSRSNSSFEFSFKTPVDVKGGVLIETTSGNFDCYDIGPGISKQTVLDAEESGKPILFNCAAGIFNLSYLVPNLDSIINNLPIRLSNQEKDAGSYSQAEQITWEIIGLLKNPLIIGVNKYERFIAAKLLVESILTSQSPYILKELNNSAISENTENILEFTNKLHFGLRKLLLERYGYTVDRKGDFIIKNIKDIKADLTF